MKTMRWPGILTLAGCLLAPAAASARSLAVELWTDRGQDAVYRPGERTPSDRGTAPAAPKSGAGTAAPPALQLSSTHAHHHRHREGSA